MSAGHDEQRKSEVLRLIEEKIALLAESEDVRCEVRGIQREKAFIQSLLLNLQRRLDETEDLSIEIIRSMEEEIKDISAWRQESNAMSGTLSTIDSKADEIFAHIRQLSMVQGLESQFSHDPLQEDSDDERSELGRGRFSKICRMRSKADGKLYAVKEIHVKKAREANIDLDKLMREVDVMTELTHPHIIRYFPCFYSSDKMHLNVVMEYADGGSLAKQIESVPGPTMATVSGWLGESLSALEYMHSRRILHRDIKPENILLKKRRVVGRREQIQGDEVYEIKLADLGPATVANSLVGHQTKIGTDVYSSYEKLTGARYDAKDDIWGLGCVFVELFTRRRLLGGNEGGWDLIMSSKKQQKKQEEVLQACRDVHPELGGLIMQMLTEDPAMRPDAAWFLGKLKQINSGASSAEAKEDSSSGDAVAVSTMAPPSASQTSPGSQDERKTAEQPSMEASTAEMVSTGSVQVPNQVVNLRRKSYTYKIHKVLQKHTGYVSCVCELSDGRIVSGSGDHTLRIWNIKAGACEHTLTGHTDWIYSVSVLSDGRIISGSRDGTLRIWSAVTGGCEHALRGHTNYVYCVSELSKGRIVSGSEDHTLRIWNAQTGVCERTLTGHVDSVKCVSVLSDDRIVSGSVDCTLRIWNAETGSCKHTMKGHTDAVACVSELSDGRIVSGSFDGTLCIWSLETGDCKYSLKGHTEAVICVSVLSNGRIVSGSWDHTLRVWNAVTGACEHTLRGHTNWIYCVSELSDGRIVSGSMDRLLRIWNAETGACEYTLTGHTDTVQCVSVLSDGCIVSSSWDRTLRIWTQWHKDGICAVM